MSRCTRSLAAALCLIVVGGLSAGERSGKLRGPDAVWFAPGRALFVQPWSSLDKRSPKGDGLGPMHNATSCAACHHQAGAGGSGDRAHNVELLSIAPVQIDQDRRAKFIGDVVALHAGFEVTSQGRSVRPNLVLHRFSTEPDYADFRQRLLGIDTPPPSSSAGVLAGSWKPVRVLEPAAGIVFNLTQRNTPALWGAGLIDSIPDKTIEELAKAQRKDRKEIAGRAPTADFGGVGRFGWRGQTARLRDFVVNACANELGLQSPRGLQTPLSAQAIDPRSPDYRLEGEDMSESDMDLLVGFVSSLPRPMEAEPANRSEAEAFREGEQVFERIGCADCHPRQHGQVNGLFSDLLLHDMGSELADPVEPNSPGHLGGYSGGGSIFVEKTKSSAPRRDPTLPNQWRTPPLWGVSDSAPYLHDGRAATLSEAILQHGGQAGASARQFRNLPNTDRERLLSFLETLKAPLQLPPVPPLQKVSF